MRWSNLNSILIIALSILLQALGYGQTSNVAPVLTATGDQIYCPGSAIKIVTDMTIVDPDDTGVNAIYIQISSGYVIGSDILILTGTHPGIVGSWNTVTGTLSLIGTAGQPTYTALIAAIKDVTFSNNSTNPTGTRSFSITIGQANYLPSLGHYYQYISNVGVTWTDAFNLAQASTYYGLQGYLATITSSAEAQLCGVQSTGTGWIGGSDAQQEGVWKWVCGPENGTIFWNGQSSGSTPNFAFWNNGEPNNLGGAENYAHITAPGVGITGSWNDLSNTGDSSGNYQPKGYVVEYGGMPNDPILHISTSTTLTIPSITTNATATACQGQTATIQATSNTGTVYWYAASSGGTSIGTGDHFTTPPLNVPTNFYAVAHSNSCPDNTRTSITVNVISTPVISSNTPYYMCDKDQKAIDVTATSGTVSWYNSTTSTIVIGTGLHFIVPNIHSSTIFYAEANDSGCLSVRTPVQVIVYPLPIAVEEDYDICNGVVLTLSAGNPNMTYQWSTGATSQSINTTGLSNYSVLITSAAPQNCSNTKQFNINIHQAPVISSVIINDLTVVINTTQMGTFEYSMDGINYQDSNLFQVIEGGLYTCYVRDIIGCGMDHSNIAVLSYPEYFTPNGDGFNDTWAVKGISDYPAARTAIYDRFGKLITVLQHSNFSWDGTYNGKPLPATDYWFVVKLNDALAEIKGHFAIKR